MKYLLFLNLLLFFGCDKRPEATSPGAKLVEKFQCYRCHDGGDKWVSATFDGGCVSCHTDILSGKKDDDYPEDQVKLWKTLIRNYPRSPNLEGARRFKPQWIEKFLLHPHDLRPSLEGLMPRLAISAEEAKTLSVFLTDSSLQPKAIPQGDPKRGELLFAQNACASCHAFGGQAPEIKEENILAPNLRYTRERMTREMTFLWLTNPKAIDPQTTMPRFEMTNTDRANLVAFLFEKKLEEVKKREKFVRLPILKRDVFYQEIETKLFRHSCWHCHSTPRWFSGLDGGPGNQGGFGYPGKGVDLSSLYTIKKGGKYNSKTIDLLEKVDGMPKLVRHMVARHEEVRGMNPDYLGMPLGLEPYPAETIQLVETWIAQGAR